jgi:chromosome segregation ATPase
MGKTKTEQIRVRIGQLEAEIHEQNQAVTDAENALADCYAKGKDPAAALSDLATARDQAAGMLSGLLRLDRELVETSQAEAVEAREKLRSEAKKRYESAMEHVRTALGPLAEKLGGTVDDPGGLVKDAEQAVARHVWEGINASFAAIYAERVPRPVSSVPSRNSYGERITDNTIGADRRDPALEPMRVGG